MYHKNNFINSFALLLALFLVGCGNQEGDMLVPNAPEMPMEGNPPSFEDIKSFLSTCPESDPDYEEILNDFEIRIDGELVNEINCTAPTTSMNVEDFQMPLILIQSLRVIKGMKTGPLPWTDETLYDWMKHSIGGIDIRTDITSGGYCCNYYDEKPFIAVRSHDEFNREFKKKWIGIASTIDLLVHEVRHLTGPSHTSCCGITRGCDQVYDLDNLSSYGTQLWLNRKWLSDEIDMGLSSFTLSERIESDHWFANAVAGFEERFCE